MTEFDKNRLQSDRPFLSKFMILIGLSLVFMFIGGLIGFAFFSYMTGMPLTEVADFQKHLQNYPNMYDAIMALQTFSTPIPFIGAAFFFWILIEKQPIHTLSLRETSLPILFLVGILVIGFMPFNAIFIELNQKMSLPDSMKSIQDWMKASEDSAAGMTKFLTDFKNPSQLTVALVVVALLAGVSEELFFRGVLQSIALKAFKNPHGAIWFAAFWFSFIHFQFFGFLPRMLLGALFGYLYFWTKNLWIPIVAHVVNNGFTLSMVYLYKSKVVKLDIESTESVPLTTALGSLVLTVVILRFFYVKYNDRMSE
ncbi:MAG: CPBP family intramembrane glutamic endopeptidase [Arcicella sp.]|nr:CPBP family intramembrane glutamic endopeptidase [Arcicella sp.]